MSKFNLVLLIHAHQPVGNFDDVMERTYQQSYLPFVECLARHPRVRMGLHYTGSLIEWMAEMHPEYIQRVGALVARGQVEIVGGGFYEPILVAIPYEDRIDQIQRLSDFVEKHFGKRPQGAWLAERVWEPQLPAGLAEAGVDYTLVDDSHFLTAGREIPELFGYYVADDCGKTVKVIPGLQELRYLLPFGTVEDSIAFLRRSANDHPGGMASMGDDMEKFGAWPHTYEHCYRDGWLDRFLSAIEANFEWLEMVPPAEALATHAPLGRVDLPTASYTEMMEWVLPTSVRQKFHSLLDEFSGRPDVRRFLRGGFWRGFFSKYAEANLLHKKMLRVSSKLRGDGIKSSRRGTKGDVLRSRAITHLLRAQCNDAYWHGIFGGLYAPHLRTELWRELVRAETIADGLHHGAKPYQTMTRLDFDADGKEEIEITSPAFAAMIKPSDGGTLGILDFRPSAVTLINSLQRRVEAYHSRLQNLSQPAGKVASIHDQTLAKEPGLEKHLKYDRWPRNSFRLLLFAPGKTHTDFEALRLEESAPFAGGDYQVAQASAEEVTLSKEAPLRQLIPGADPKSILAATKILQFEKQDHGFDVRCRLELALKDTEYIAEGAGGSAQILVGLEIVINLLAPNVPDRYIEFAGARKPLEWSGMVDGKKLRIADEWQNVAVDVEVPCVCHFWVSPVQTVSESEEGFERVYQGSQILGVWSVTLDPAKPWSAETVLHISKTHNS
ncbi:MAG TPA: alpha-amylase/4-alpha-glucanotransferase domain-containing protein [Candidatus Saccharimonadales bacterium]|nr:alpha-amylase/4-alpha-glucanotransferase domain-containing protein [Candidatus Saccharimonadales bacterium]